MIKRFSLRLIPFRCLLALAQSFVAVSLMAQVSPLADQFLVNPFLTNPAFAGTSSAGLLNLTARQQWLGIDGAPSWQSATWHTSLNARKQRFNPRGFINKGENAFGNIGLGGGIFRVSYGAISQTGVHLDYAYHVFMNGGRLSFGLAPHYQQYVIDKTGFNPPDGVTPDPLIDGDEKELIHFLDVNAGVHYYSDHLFVGLSAVQLLNSSVSFGDLSFSSASEFNGNPWLSRSLYLYGGWIANLSRNVTLEPTLLARYNQAGGFIIQASVSATLNKSLQAGLLYRYREAGGLFVSVNYENLIFRYQFELPIGTGILNRFTSHQIMVGYRF